MSSPTRSATDLLESIEARETVVLQSLEAAAGNQSLCTLSRGRTPLPAVKYHEGAASALAEARRAVRAVPDDPNVESTLRATLTAIHERWLAQSRSPGRTGPSWTGYLTGGLDAIEQMIQDAGSGVRDANS